jgi:ABC-type cobalamin/Fe3+-siderophores transport system ATPase subunit
MLKSIVMKFTHSDDIEFPTNGITIFVGPNNSGKSLILKEIESTFHSTEFSKYAKILKDFQIDWPELEAIQEGLIKNSASYGTEVPENHLKISRINPGGGRQIEIINISTLIQKVTEKNDKHWWSSKVLRWKMLRLDGRSRFNLTNDQTAGDLLADPQNVLAKLFKDDITRRKVSNLIKEAFGLYFVVDPTSLGNLRIRLSKEHPPADEQSLNQVARDFHNNAMHILESSDGVQAFTGIITAVLSGDFETILIDEPEAFLHPPLARKLGKNLAALTTERGGCLLASTHSPDFLMGCVQATKEVRVVRLEYSEGKSRGRKVDPVQLEKMFSNPLMRSTNAISGLFYDGVVVTESDNDRVFYSEIYYRLSVGNSDYPSILFINAQNKQTIKDIIDPLRRFGVPAAAIPDIDIVKDGGKVWTEWLTSAQIPSALYEGYGSQRNAIEKLLVASGKNMKSDGGINILSQSDKLAAEQLFDNIAEYGVFVVRHGELENWLSSLGVNSRKDRWTVDMLNRLGSDPAVSNYVVPSDGDVWDFIREVVSWIKNPARKGTS